MTPPTGIYDPPGRYAPDQMYKNARRVKLDEIICLMAKFYGMLLIFMILKEI